MKTQLPATIREMLNSDAFQRFEESKLGNDLFTSDPDRASRMCDAAENGCDGSTHAERIDDWREFVDSLKDDAECELWNSESEEKGEAMEGAINLWWDQITREIDACESWHSDNGSLHEEIG